MKVGTATIVPFVCESSSGDRRAQRSDLLQAVRLAESPLIVDLSACETLDQDDIGLLLECLAQATARDTKVLLVANARVNRVLLEVTRISSLVPVLGSVAEALANPETPATHEGEDLNAKSNRDARSA